MKVKIRSKFILLLFVGIIVLLLGGIYFAAQQEKEGPITAEAAISHYWSSTSLPTTCPACGGAGDIRVGGYSSSGSCKTTLTHYVNNAGGGGGSFARCVTEIYLHKAVTTVPKREPTCTTGGNEHPYTYCQVCHEYATSVVTIPPLGHNWSGWQTQTEASCTKAGLEYRRCTRNGCGQRQTNSIPPIGHSFTNYTSNNDAKCTEDGTETAKCDRCEVTDTRTDEGSALGHDIEYHAGKEPTCTAIGWSAYETCNRTGCGYTTYREIAATGHTPGAAATCTTPQTCTECGTTLAEATGHTWDSGTISKNPTCYSLAARSKRKPYRK